VGAALSVGAVGHSPATDVDEGIVTAAVLTRDGSIVGIIYDPHFSMLTSTTGSSFSTFEGGMPKVVGRADFVVSHKVLRTTVNIEARLSVFIGTTLLIDSEPGEGVNL